MKEEPQSEQNPQTNPDFTETPQCPTEPVAENNTPSLEVQLKESQDRYLYLVADFDNYRKRMSKERLEWVKNASESVILSLLPVLDDFERAMEQLHEEKQGIELIYNKLKSQIMAQGLKEMSVKDAAFDDQFHEAVAQMPTEDPKQKGKVFEVVQKGYLLNEKVLRHAKVVVYA